MARPGLLAFGAYVPRRRLERKAILAATGWAGGARGGRAAGRRSYCAWDEDSLTMAVEAARDCLAGVDRAAVRQVVFASTTHPWADRSNAGVVAGALDLDDSVRASDASGHQQAGLGAVLDACQRVRDGDGEILVVAADRRIARPASEQELRFGHGAAAVRVGTGECIAELLGSRSLRADFVDHYRAAGADADYALEERWIRDEGYRKLVPEAVAGALASCALAPSAVRHLVVQAPARHADAVARDLGIAADAVRDDLQGECGDTGVAHPLLMLGDALERAAAGEVIVVAGFGQGCDALVLRATGRPATTGAGCRGALAAGAADGEYLRFLSNCGLVELDWGARAERDNRTAQTVAWRRHRDLLGFVGGRCSRCGTVQFPRTRACVNPDCRAFDTQVGHPLAESRGTVKTYTEDWLAVTRSPPCVYGNVALENGANVFVEFADTGPGAVAVGTPVRFVFRIKDLDSLRGFRRYFWKATPVES
jgi:3-hydroxy-3-methylglutaryl CoA synthase/uncharacterized OB-fold protein